MSKTDTLSAPASPPIAQPSPRLSMTGREWRMLQPEQAIPPELEQTYGSLIARLLVFREVTDAALAASFLAPSLHEECGESCRGERAVHLHDPFLMKDMDLAVQRVDRALQAGQKIAVYGDFDTDGVTAVTLLVQMLKAFGGDVLPYIPDRKSEGYGLNGPAIEQLRREWGVELLITVDCGISNFAEVARANELGIDVVVLDHHHVPEQLPAAAAVVNPKRRDCSYPFKGLCGVGIAFKLFEALRRRYPHLYGKQSRFKESLDPAKLLDVVAIGTIADMMPLYGENRLLVASGLEALRRTKRPGLRALIEVARLEQTKISATDIAFGLAPRINAAGRLEDAKDAYELLLAERYDDALQRARQIDETNTQRRELMEDSQEHARQLVRANGWAQSKFIVIVGDEQQFHHGIVGLVAGRLAEEFYRPVLVLGRGESQSRGSARSIPNFNVVEALGSCKELFVKYGGHAAAAGCTIANEHLRELEQRLLAVAETLLTDELLQRVLWVDAEAPLSQLSEQMLAWLEQLAPFGQENCRPLFVSSGLEIDSIRAVGPDGKHLKLRILQQHQSTATDGYRPRPMDAIAFGLGRLLPQLSNRPRVDLVYAFEANEYRGTRRLQLNVKDIRLAE